MYEKYLTQDRPEGLMRQDVKAVVQLPQTQKMSDLPGDSLEPFPPFTSCAVDYLTHDM